MCRFDLTISILLRIFLMICLLEYASSSSIYIYRNEIVGITDLLLRLMLYWIYKQHKFFWLPALPFHLGHGGIKECIEFSLF